MDGLIFASLLEQEIEVADNHAQQIIEIVGDAARQLSDRLQLLRPEELFLRLYSLRGLASERLDRFREGTATTPFLVRLLQAFAHLSSMTQMVMSHCQDRSVHVASRPRFITTIWVMLAASQGEA